MQSTTTVAKFRYKTDLDKATLVHNFEKRGWAKCQENEQWNIFWALPQSVRNIYNPYTGFRLAETQ